MSESALSNLKNGELCTVVVDGQEREAEWIAHNRWFRFTTPPAGIARPEEVEEWWPASVKF